MASTSRTRRRLLACATAGALLPLGAGISWCVGEVPTPADKGDTAAVVPASQAARDLLPVDLPTALRLVNTSNPTIALAQARLEEAYALQRQAEVAWLPDLRAGPAYGRHDGRIQNSTGIVFDTSKSNLFMGGGAYLSWDTTNLYFGPLIARRLTQAEAAAAQAVTNDVQLDVAVTYLELLRVYAALAINQDSLARAEDIRKAAEIGAGKAGAGLAKPADLSRALNEVNLRRAERIDLQGQVGVVSARLSQLLLLPPTVNLQPQEPPVVPISLVPLETPLGEMIATGLQNRPELREGQLLEAAAQARLRQARISPFLPKLEVGYSAGTFGGGLDGRLGDFGGRGDGTAQAVWELRNLGAGNVAQARARQAQANQANFHVAEIQAQVGAEVASAARLVRSRHEALAVSQDAVREALLTWQRLRVALFGMAAGEGRRREFEPLEALLAEQEIDQSRVRYLNEVIEYNKSQFRLYWAMGQPPLCALPAATAEKVDVPVVPSEYKPAQALPLNEPGKEEKK